MPANDSSGSTRELKFSFGERTIRCWAGDTVAAALTAAGERTLRVTADGLPRGIFCGMGVCQECLVTVDGVPDQRACMIPAREGIRVEQNPALRSLDPTATSVIGSTHQELEVIRPQLLVIGGGPAGLTAAASAAELGVEVVLLDERSSIGGQFYKQSKSAGRIPLSLSGDSQFADGQRLIERTVHSGATLKSNAEVWGAFDGRQLAVLVDGVSRIYRPDRIIVAAGAYERGLPIPGWTLPGVMTTGAAQTLLRSHGVLPGKRILIGGNGPLNFQVALELSRAGAEIVALAELAGPPGVGQLLQALRMVSASPSLTLKGLGILSGLRSARVPTRYNCCIAAIETADADLCRLKVSLATTVGDGRETMDVQEVDSVCMGYGFLPNNELLRLLGCMHRYDRRSGYMVTERSDDCETSVEGVFAIGDCCGLGGAPAGMAEGTVSAHAVARSLGCSAGKAGMRRLQSARAELGRQRRFQSALWSLYAAPRFDVQLSDDDTVICRCEQVTLQSLNNAVASGLRSLGQIKRLTRLGMGACQGRYCAPLALSVLERQCNMNLDQYSMFAPRVPVRPISIENLLSTRGT